jgi:hypothetical protein
MAQSGQIEVSAVCPLSGAKQTKLLDDALSAFDPGCVKTPRFM